MDWITLLPLVSLEMQGRFWRPLQENSELTFPQIEYIWGRMASVLLVPARVWPGRSKARSSRNVDTLSVNYPAMQWSTISSVHETNSVVYHSLAQLCLLIRWASTRIGGGCQGLKADSISKILASSNSWSLSMLLEYDIVAGWGIFRYSLPALSSRDLCF